MRIIAGKANRKALVTLPGEENKRTSLLSPPYISVNFLINSLFMEILPIFGNLFFLFDYPILYNKKRTKSSIYIKLLKLLHYNKGK